jgi:hypothetical protein
MGSMSEASANCRRLMMRVDSTRTYLGNVFITHDDAATLFELLALHDGATGDLAFAARAPAFLLNARRHSRWSWLKDGVAGPDR